MSPFYITEGGPYRPEMILWLELPGDRVVGSRLIDPKQAPVSFGATLLEAMRTPLVGPPRRPDRVRIADARLAAEIRASVPEMELVVAPTPELDRLLQVMASTMPRAATEEGPSYFEGGRVGAERVEALFRAAAVLFGVAPWKVVDDHQVLRLDVPGLGVEGACVSIIGALGESLGLIIFPSLLAFERFLAVARAGAVASDEPIDVGTSSLSLNFERASDLPASMRREAARHGWPVARPDAYPWVQHRDRDGMLRPLGERDVRLVTACATSLASFVTSHGNVFKGDFAAPVCESFFDENDLEVRFTVPYEAGPRLEANAPPPGQPGAVGKVGRNDPCPCGSGKKYKKCCLGGDEGVSAAERAPASIHEVDQRFVEQMFRFAHRRFGEQWLVRAGKDFDDPDMALPLFVPWAVYHFLVEGKPIVQWYVEERRRQLSNTELSWLEAQRVSWLSVWEVLAVEPGRSIRLRDLLTDEERTVHEVSGSKTVARRDALLGRIVDHGGISVLGGSHPRPLPPMESAEVVEALRRRLRRKRGIPTDRLRDEKVGRHLIACWEEAVGEFDARRSVPPRLQNTDGDELLLTVDHFELEASARAELHRRLATLEGVDPPEAGSAEQVYRFVRPGNPVHKGLESTLVGRAIVAHGKLRLETNSIRRADALRKQIEEVCTGLVRHRTREHSDPLALMGDAKDPGDTEEAPLELPSGELDRAILEMKRKHYATWADHPLEPLGGKTPREASRSRAGREQVDLLLKDCENREAREPQGQRFDFSVLRRELNIDT